MYIYICIYVCIFIYVYMYVYVIRDSVVQLIGLQLDMGNLMPSQKVIQKA